MRSLRLFLAGLVFAALYAGAPAHAQFFEPRYEAPPRYQPQRPPRQRTYPPGYIPPSERQYVNPSRQYVPQQQEARPRVGFFQRLFPRLGLPAPRWPSGGQQQVPQQQYNADSAPAAPRPAAPKKPAVQQTTFVAVIGDSLAENLANGLVEALSERPEVGLVREIRPGIGFLKETDKPWRDVIDEIFLREKPVTAAVIMMGPYDDPPKKPNADAPADAPTSGGASWMDLYAAKVDDVILSFRQRNIPLLWVALPPVADQKTSTDYAFANELVQQRLQSLGGIFIDVWEGFVDDDEQFMTQGPNLEGRTVRLRMADGVHFTRAGSAKLAHYVELELRGYLTTKDDANTDAEIAKEISAPLTPGSSRILLLGEAPRTPGAILVPPAPAAPAQSLPDVEMAQKAMRDGEVVPPKPGRGDDFSWTDATAPEATVTPVAN
ncbi:DUF459 domain-containing protein [Flaviflagellibacter deserti]|uniref:DUF459 domain-containing protein n=1 Tax=Flaviflagellibacter deserti TaxID=2267266 RepID=A0ABV9YZK7_9HYPH